MHNMSGCADMTNTTCFQPIHWRNNSWWVTTFSELPNIVINKRMNLVSIMSNVQKQFIAYTFDNAKFEIVGFHHPSICKPNGKLIRKKAKRKTRCTCLHTPTVACSTTGKSNQGWCIGKCQTRINGLITLLSLLPLLSLLKFPTFLQPPFCPRSFLLH